jgi:hypothetical protein
MYKLSFYVPVSDSDRVKDVIFKTGAGKIGLYDQCCWETLGRGQFRPLSGSNPAIGEHGKLERIDELKVEMVCADQFIQDAVTALKKAHPYEEPAYEVYRLEDM